MFAQSFTYTVVAAGELKADTPFNVYREGTSLENAYLTIATAQTFNIHLQQSGELGALLLFLSMGACDHSSIPELLEGYGANEEELKSFVSELKSLISALES